MFINFIQIAIIIGIIGIIARFVGIYIAQVFNKETTWLDPIISPLEKCIYSLSGLEKTKSMTAMQYIRALLFTNIIMGIWVYLILMLQGLLPLNPTELVAPSWHLALHTTISFLTNTDQQHYSGETTLSYLSQILGITFLMFTSAGTGLAVGIAFIRGSTGRALGNFYVDLIQSITRILLPISLVGAIALLIAGVPETLAGPAIANTLEGNTQYIARGPVAHLEIIKQLGENGGGFFGINSAHPLENPNGFSNLIETIAMVIIPAGLIHTYGIFAGNNKQGWLLFWMVFIIYALEIVIVVIAENQGNPIINNMLEVVGPNLEGKEIRFGSALTALFAVTTTGTMCGAVNAMHDSLMPLGGLVTLSNLFLQVIWGGQGIGTAYLYIFLILTIFLTGLMVGRTPEFLGRKIEKREIVLASILLLVHPISILIPSAITLAFSGEVAGISNPGFHGLTQVVYEYASAGANNGSGFEGLADNTLWWNLTASLSILIGRYVPIITLLLLADNLAHKKPVPETVGTLRTDTILFTTVTAGSILIIGALTFLPVIALGPIAEFFQIARDSVK